MRILIILLLITSCKSGSKYNAPVVEDCILLAKHIDTDKFECFCIDKNINKNNFNNLYDKVKRNMSDHPAANDMLSYITDNKNNIIKKKEYKLNGYYCRGYSAISSRNREKLTNWAENNRINRIKCEKGY